ncbi:hypothetical protein BOX15_Mlig013497g2 [Macrostomum lignano]|uniref:MFS domain-containing protein n=1 Tax=Macrostomum lignano TaxID=282301 RepID=A0A267H2I0_9PLAT|nr:hypothetical protein BOX15_Mlig013497g2 [Macrostomum lignano]
MLAANKRHIISSYLVMMVLFFCKTSESLLQPSVRIYVYQQVCMSKGISLAVCESHSQGDSQSKNRLHMTDEQQSIVQRTASKYLLAYRMLVNLPAVFFSVFAGSWSDRVGRKYPMMLPPLGAILATVCYGASSAIDDSTNLGWVMAGAAVYGFFGKSTVMTIACSSYVADISNAEDRTKLLGRLLAMNFFGVFVGSLLTSIFQCFNSVNSMLLVVLVINLAIELTIVLFVHESVESAESASCYQLVCPCMNTDTKSWAIRDSIGFLLRRRPQQLLLLFLFVSLCVNQICKQGEHDVLLLLSKHEPFNWPGHFYGYYLSVYYASMGLNLVVILPIMMRWMDLRDSVLVMVGLFMKIIRMVIIGTATSTLMLYSSAVLGCFAGFIVSAIKSMTSKLVEESEIGQTFSLLSCAESVASLVGPSLFSPIYASTVDIFPGSVFCLDAGVQILLLCCFFRIYLTKGDIKVYENGDVKSISPEDANAESAPETNRRDEASEIQVSSVDESGSDVKAVEKSIANDNQADAIDTGTNDLDCEKSSKSDLSTNELHAVNQKAEAASSKDVEDNVEVNPESKSR